jgi:predicted nucleotidyltransferase component of viral defense system
MQDLIKQEQFEIEVLDRLKSGRFLDNLIFTGGTMLRLCYGLNRFSVDLDFWLY